MKRIGRRMIAALEFARRYAGWHTFEKTERHAIERLAARGLVVVNSFQQFKAI